MIINIGKKILLSLLVVILVSLPLYFLPQLHIGKEKVLPISYSSPPGSLVVARVGIYTLSEVSGWTSPYAEVTLTGKALARKTIANQDGFFLFINVPVRENLGELCLVAEDINHIASFPTCVPPPQPKDELVIKNILLPPSISLEKGEITLGKTAKASGMTFPESEVDVRLSVEKKGLPSLYNFYKNYKTYNPPSYKITSNPNGYFEFSLPTANASENRLFAVSRLSNLGDLGNLGSPKSNTLTFLVYKSYWLILLLLFLLLLLVLFFILKKEKKNKLLVLENEITVYQPYCETKIFFPKILRF